MSTYIKQLSGAFQQLQNCNKIGLAVSGGPDSMALTWFAQKMLPKHKLVCYLVNHNMHAQSNHIIEKTTEYLHKQGIKYKVMSINEVSSSPKSAREDNLRALRYSVIEKEMYSSNVRDLLTGHNHSDDIETFLLRTMSHSGIMGLMGILPMSRTPIYKLGYLHRPLLDISKPELLQVCNTNNIPYFIDPTNKDLNYKRNKIRDILNRIDKNLLVFPGSDSFKSSNLSRVLKFYKTIGRLNHLKADSVLKEFFLNDPNFGIGLLNIPKGVTWLQDESVSFEVLKRIIHYIHPNSSPPRLSQLAKMRSALINGFKNSISNCSIWIRNPELSTGPDNYMMLPLPLQLKVANKVQLYLPCDKVPDYAIKTVKVTESALAYDLIFNNRYLLNFTYLKCRNNPIFIRDAGEFLEIPDYVKAHFEVLKMNKFNLRIKFGNSELVGRLDKILRLLSKKLTSDKLQSRNLARQFRTAFEHFTAKTPQNCRVILPIIVHIDDDGLEYPVAAPNLKINFIQHACQFKFRYLGDMNYINK